MRQCPACNGPVCDICAGCINCGECACNVRKDAIIAELLEVLERLISNAPTTPANYDELGAQAFTPEARFLIDIQNQARAAIAKAKGENA